LSFLGASQKAQFFVDKIGTQNAENPQKNPVFSFNKEKVDIKTHFFARFFQVPKKPVFPLIFFWFCGTPLRLF
jgi:hypothetical protein